MSDSVKRYLKVAIYIAIAIFVICSLISMPNSFKDFSRYTGLSVSITIVISILYEKWVWKLNPLEKTPKLYKRYKGILEYNYKGKIGNKTIEVNVKQSLFHLNIQLVSDETISSTITSKIVKENGYYVLYYTYITNPKSKFSDKNPVQYGTCRFIIDNPKKLSGIYWTSRKTKGDIYLDLSVVGEGKMDGEIVSAYSRQKNKEKVL
ncbi:Cap15 family cyclic dinucleotide receptor domain-containing protein [Lederbergia lenta]|uniref:CD-NTase-associated protein 15 domain-containing protein n=1 Tax=Lederbergia lenta TaxID=1467 RepID=A0A2X4WL75_LEDLE|nr:hypothetical protein [Lederbergia lenta]MEC2326206.1 hypothetical protein [Lederbergia lenta]SQI63673.1 Uncharacterised protein [Lederbergia lenta]